MNPHGRVFIYLALLFGVAYYTSIACDEIRRGDRFWPWVGVGALVFWCSMVFVLSRPRR